MADRDVAPLRPAEFCALQRQLIATMAMRKKRNVEMAPMQELKAELLRLVEEADPEPAAFTPALRAAIDAVSGGLATGPAQAVASDLQMDWDMACSSPGFIDWLRTEATVKRPPRRAAPPNG
jgi:hypothetical protein